MADRRQMGISDGWRGQAPSRRKVVNRRSSCLRRHQRRLKTDPMCRSKTDPPGHDRTGYQPSVRRPFPPARHLPRYQNRPVTIVETSGHDAGIAGHDTGTAPVRSPEPAVTIIGIPILPLSARLRPPNPGPHRAPRVDSPEFKSNPGYASAP